jgi:negative regulator of sigma E activity
MSDQSRTPHLDDERLSALIDGEGTPVDEEHVRTCAECAAALAAWERTVDALAEPAVFAEAARRDAAVDAALDAALAAAAGASVAGTPSRVDGPAESRGAAPCGGPVPLANRRRERVAFFWPRVAVAAAAVIVIAGVAVGVSTSGGGGTSHPAAAPVVSTIPSAAAGSAAEAPSAAPTTGVGNGVPGPSNVVSDLGSVQDSGGLVAALQERLNSLNPDGLNPGSGTPTASSTVVPRVPSPTTSACLPQAASYAQAPAGSRPVVAAGLTYRGSPAQVYVFQVGGHHTAVVVGVPGCRSLTVAAF